MLMFINVDSPIQTLWSYSKAKCSQENVIEPLAGRGLLKPAEENTGLYTATRGRRESYWSRVCINLRNLELSKIHTIHSICIESPA